jgi:hypothetical protein
MNHGLQHARFRSQEWKIEPSPFTTTMNKESYNFMDVPKI